MIKPADRLSHFSEYYFSAKLREIKELVTRGRPIINLGIGSPDMMPHERVIDTLATSAHQPQAHGYQPYQGIPELKASVREFYKNNYHQAVPDLEVLPLMGSKEGITHISLAYLNPGDQVLIPGLGYPTYTSVSRMVGAEPVYYPLQSVDNWEPDWDFLEAMDCSRVKLIWINYPHMPTGTKGSLSLLEKFVTFARSRGLLLCHDNPYSFIGNDQPLSVFNASGAEEVAIELGSLSKTFNMAGWRVGWALGSAELVQPVLQIKSNMDSGMFRPVQMAAIEALRLSSDWFAQLNQVYARRRSLASQIFDKLGCEYLSGQSGMFLWAKVPDGGTGESFTNHLLDQYNLFIAPGFIFGKHAGDKYVRMSLCAPEEIIEEALNRLT